MSRLHPTILIGLDGAAFSVLDDMIARGHMPFLQEFMAGGTRAGLMSTPHPLTPPAWTTVMTGRTPGHHGIFDFLKVVTSDTGRFFTVNGFRDIQCETIWSLVSRSEGRVISLNFPLMAPPPAVSGVIVPGMIPLRHLRLNVHPRSVYEQIVRLPAFKDQDVSKDGENKQRMLQWMPDEQSLEEGLEQWVGYHIHREQLWFAILGHLMKNNPADLTAVMFEGIDKIQHPCWQFLDPKYWSDRPTEFETRMRKVCAEYFQRLDGLLREIAVLAGPRARLFIVSDHGFGPTTKVFRVNTWLHQRGYLQWRDESDRTATRSRGPNLPIDWNRTVAYAQSVATNGIYITVARRDGENGVRPEDYTAFRDQLIRDLRELRDPDAGTPLVKDVLKREDVFPGPYMEKAPDLTLVMFDHGLISVLNREPLVWTRPAVGGTHNPEGIFIARGPGIRAGHALPPQTILDTAPTLLYSLGLSIPEDYESQGIQDCFESSHLAAHPVTRGQPAQQAREEAGVVGPEIDDRGEEIIFRRLRELGYVE